MSAPVTSSPFANVQCPCIIRQEPKKQCKKVLDFASQTIKCAGCALSYCMKHRLPEAHKCTNYDAFIEKQKEQFKKNFNTQPETNHWARSHGFKSDQ